MEISNTTTYPPSSTNCCRWVGSQTLAYEVSYLVIQKEAPLSLEGRLTVHYKYFTTEVYCDPQVLKKPEKGAGTQNIV